LRSCLRLFFGFMADSVLWMCYQQGGLLNCGGFHFIWFFYSPLRGSFLFSFLFVLEIVAIVPWHFLCNCFYKLGEICVHVFQQNLNCEWRFVANEVLKKDKLWFYRLRKLDIFNWNYWKRNTPEHCTSFFRFVNFRIIIVQFHDTHMDRKGEYECSEFFWETLYSEKKNQKYIQCRGEFIFI